MLEHFNDYISIFILIFILLIFIYLVFKIFLNTIERNRIKKAMEDSKKRKTRIKERRRSNAKIG